MKCDNVWNEESRSVYKELIEKDQATCSITTLPMAQAECVIFLKVYTFVGNIYLSFIIDSK